MSTTQTRRPPLEFRALAHGRGDPTNTKTARSRYSAQMFKRFRAIKGAVRRLVVERDAFGLRANTAVAEAVHGAATPGVRAVNTRVPLPDDVPDVPPPAEPTYSFPTDNSAAAVESFLRWLRDAMAAVVLGGDASAMDPENRWTAKYIRYAYAKGLSHAEQAMLREAGLDVDEVSIQDAFNTPLHRDTLSMFFRRQFTLLRGITDAVASDVSRELSAGVLRGENPRDIAETINQRIDAIGVTRARTLARTEIIHSFNEASLNRYSQELGESGSVNLVAEFATAGDARVCEECRDLDGATFSIADARGVIPQHPNCRCAWLPVTPASDRGG